MIRFRFKILKLSNSLYSAKFHLLLLDFRDRFDLDWKQSRSIEAGIGLMIAASKKQKPLKSSEIASTALSSNDSSLSIISKNLSSCLYNNLLI